MSDMLVKVVDVWGAREAAFCSRPGEVGWIRALGADGSRYLYVAGTGSSLHEFYDLAAMCDGILARGVIDLRNWRREEA